tara:strand:- start:62 stop:448 length:387 start_codon:yes stop_codon:yes gene_type:complete
MAYVSQSLKKELAPAIKAVLKKYKMKGSIAVDNHSTLVVNLKSGAIDFQKDFQNECSTTGKYHYQVNPYWFQDHYKGAAKAFLTELLAAMKPADKWFDNSDPMTDYFHTAYYVDVNIGKWNQEYEVAA